MEVGIVEAKVKFDLEFNKHEIYFISRGFFKVLLYSETNKQRVWTMFVLSLKIKCPSSLGLDSRL